MMVKLVNFNFQLLKNRNKRKKAKIIFHSILPEEFFKRGFEAMIKFVKIYAGLSTTNSEIEREFACLKRIKTDWTNKLSVGRIQNPRMRSPNGEDLRVGQMEVITIGTQFVIYET